VFLLVFGTTHCGKLAIRPEHPRHTPAHRFSGRFPGEYGWAAAPFNFPYLFSQAVHPFATSSTVHIILTRVALGADARRRTRPTHSLPLIHHLLSLSYPSLSSSCLLFLFLPSLGAAMGLGKRYKFSSGVRRRAPAANACRTNLTTENTSGDNRFGERST